MDQPVMRDIALFLLRFALGIIFIAHGLQKFLVQGIEATSQQFAAWGVPQPKLCALLSATGEVLGGACLLLGLLTTFVAGVLALEMIAALVIVHLDAGFFVQDNGMEYPLVLIVALFMIVVFGAGRGSLDKVLSRAEV